MQKIPETFSKCSAQSLFSAEKNLLKNRLQSSIFSPENLLENPKKMFSSSDVLLKAYPLQRKIWDSNVPSSVQQNVLESVNVLESAKMSTNDNFQSF